VEADKQSEIGEWSVDRLTWSKKGDMSIFSTDSSSSATWLTY
jgi:hypothetical protein